MVCALAEYVVTRGPLLQVELLSGTSPDINPRQDADDFVDFSRLFFTQSNLTFSAVKLLPHLENGMS